MRGETRKKEMLEEEKEKKEDVRIKQSIRETTPQRSKFI
jgi:hypothetical protein